MFQLFHANSFFFKKTVSNYLFDLSSELEVTVAFLVEIDKLIQLLESPIYMCTNQKSTFSFYQNSQLFKPKNLALVILTCRNHFCRTDLRLQLLEADKYPHLFKTLFGLLMLLPQSSAFETLKNRLGTVTSLGVMQVLPKSAETVPPVKDVDFPALLVHFSTLQQKHAESIRSSTYRSTFSS